MSSTTESLATISRVNIDILPAERNLSDGLINVSNEQEGKYNIFQVKERLQDNTKSSTRPRNLIPTWSSNSVTGERKEKPLQPLNKDQKPKDQVSDMHVVFISEKRLENSVTEVWIVLFGCILVVVLGRSALQCISLNIMETKGILRCLRCSSIGYLVEACYLYVFFSYFSIILL